MPAYGKPLQRGLDILEILAEANLPLGYAALRNRIDTSPASFSRFLRILVERGYAVQTLDGQYALGPRLAAMGLIANDRLPIRAAAESAMQALLAATEESVELVQFLPNNEFLFLQRCESPQAVVLRARPGHRFATNMETAIGRIAFAFGAVPPPPAAASILTPIRETAVCSLRQNDNQVLRISSPLFAADGSCLGCLTVAAPAFRVSAEKQQQFEQLLIEQAAAVSHSLGYSPAAITGLKNPELP